MWGWGCTCQPPFGKCSPIFCLSKRASVSELRRVQVWPSELMRCGMSPGESRSSLKLPSSARLCRSVTLQIPPPSKHAIIFSTHPHLYYCFSFNSNIIHRHRKVSHAFSFPDLFQT